MKMINYYLTAPFFLIFMALIAMGPFNTAFSQEIPPDVDVVAEKSAEPVNPFARESNAPLVLELFSTQACLFCPQADRFFAALIKQPNVIGLSCHVDYFDVKEGALSQPFCTERQSWYMNKLGAGPNYTPQMVMQGQYDVVGYKMDDIKEGLHDAARQNIELIEIESAHEAHSFNLTLPLDTKIEDDIYQVRLALYDKPHELIVSGGHNRGKAMTYYNIVSALTDLGAWPLPLGSVAVIKSENIKGFAVLVQNPDTGAIVAAGQYLF